MEEGLDRGEAQCQARFGLSVGDGAQGSLVNVAGAGREEQRKSNHGYQIRRDSGLGEDDVEVDEQQDQFRYAGDEAVVHGGKRAQPDAAAAAHLIQDDSQHGSQQDGQDADLERFPKAAGDEFPAILGQQVLADALFEPRPQAAMFPCSFPVHHEVGGVVVVIVYREQEFLFPFGGNEDTAAKDIGQSRPEGQDAGTYVVQFDF